MANLVESIYNIINSFFTGGGASLFLPFAYLFALVACFDIFLSFFRR